MLILWGCVDGPPKKRSKLMANRLGLVVAIIALSAARTLAAELPSPTCGLGPSDWCPVPASDRCGTHKDAASCKADPACFGMPYRGESVVACQLDPRGFASNCPTVGCTSVSPKQSR
jgi:hypothetical protein